MSQGLLLLRLFVGSAIAALLPSNASNLESAWAGLVALAVAVPLALLNPDEAGGRVLGSASPGCRASGSTWPSASTASPGGSPCSPAAWACSSFVGALLPLARGPAARFYALLLGFMGSMLGLVLSGNVLQFVLFWELTGIFSFLLCGSAPW
jgi:multicomponent K+:H+ antiporter subunit A